MARIHFVYASIHTLSHLPLKTLHIRPSIIFSQWVMENTIGNLGEEIRLHSNPFANLAKHSLHHCQINALKSMVSDLESGAPCPWGSLDIGGGFVLLVASEKHANPVTDCEAEVISQYIHGIDSVIDTTRYHKIMQWAHLHLPNGQIVCSRWKEDARSAWHVQISRNVKVSYQRFLFSI